MNKSRLFRTTVSVTMAAWMTVQPLTTVAEDIDIFIGASAGTSDRPNVLIVLDNTSNWARQSQQWPGGLQQGQAEVRSIKTVINALPADASGNLDFNIGVMEFVTNGTANDTGGFTRSAIKWMNSANKAALSAQMDQIFGDINGVAEKRNSNTEYGDLIYDVYNYFAGDSVSLDGSNATRNLNPPNSYVDASGYTSTYTKFKTPLSSTNSCANNFVIFISNPNSSGPATDTAANKTALANLGGDTSTIALPNMAQQTIATTSGIGSTTACYSSQANCTSALGAAGEFPTCPPTGSGYASCACTTQQAAPPTCGAGTQRYTVYGQDIAGTTNLGYMSSCVSNTNSCDTSSFASQCTGTGVSCACNASDYVTTGCSSNKKKFMVQRTKANTTQTPLGYTSACYANLASCSTADYAAQCSSATYPSGCICSTPTTTSTACPGGTARYDVEGTTTNVLAAPTGTEDANKGAPWLLDEWARFLYQKGVPVSGGDNQKVATYTIDVYNKQQNADHTALMMTAAKVGGGKYYAATNEQALEDALTKILLEIKAVNTTFASASLPVNATNRAQNENQVFIGMFRPDPNAKPRWFGNLKRYQLILGSNGVSIELGDKDGALAINNNTGFIGDCAASWWTTDSPKDPTDLSLGYYWKDYPVSPSPISACPLPAGASQDKLYSDLPDGPTVEKGAVAEVVRKGNNPPTSDSTPTWAFNRTFYTTDNHTSTTLLSGFNASSALNTTQQDWTKGKDTENEDSDTNVTETRASLHGDVVHSRPLPVNYGGNIVLYYGSNDGHFRAVDADSGKELWTFMPFEFAQPALVDRLRTNSPIIKYPGIPSGILPTPRVKDYAWDGSIGVSQNASGSQVWIYPTMRRGGKRVYALDVSSSTSPTIKWIVGCNNDGTNCTGGFSDIGQTWSTPNIAPVDGYPTQNVAFFGGGYDPCEDTDVVNPPCGTPKGAKVYAVDADTGSLLWSAATDRSVPADIALLDINSDGKADYGYAVDTGGNIYRIDMVTRSVAGTGSVTYTSRAPASWTMRKVASTTGAGRKFLFAPALLPSASDGRVYLALGSGDREHPLQSNYPYGNVTNRLYVLVDNLAVTSGSAMDLDTLQDKTTDLGCASTAITPTTTPTGWFMDLRAYGQGEQTVTSAIIVGGLVAFSTNRPIPSAAGTCSTVLGEARGYWVNLLTGAGAIGVGGNCGGQRSSTFVGGGLPPSPVLGTVPINGILRTVVIGAVQRAPGVNTPISPQKVTPPITPIRKRVYWKQQGID